MCIHHEGQGRMLNLGLTVREGACTNSSLRILLLLAPTHQRRDCPDQAIGSLRFLGNTPFSLCFPDISSRAVPCVSDSDADTSIGILILLGDGDASHPARKASVHMFGVR